MGHSPDAHHVFAFFVDDTSLNPARVGEELTLHHAQLCHRIASVLRLRPSDEVVLFDGVCVVRARLCEVPSKKRVTVIVVQCDSPQWIPPSVIVVCPILKREAFEAAVYSSAQMGAKAFIPVIAGKCHRTFGGDRELVRLKKIVRAACEQAKQYHMLAIEQQSTLSDAFSKLHPARWIHLDPGGKPLLELLCDIQKRTAETIVLCVGPEGGFTSLEQDILASKSAQVRLTPSVLRSHEALALALGSLRSLQY